MANYQNDLVVLTIGGINAKSVGNTTLAVTEDGTQRFFPLILTITCTAATLITSGPQVNVGVTGAAYSDIWSVNPSAAVNATNETFTQMGGNNVTSIAPGTSIVARVVSAASGTSMTIRVDVIGYYA